MNKELTKRYKESMDKEYTKEQLIDMVMKRDDRICDIRAFINQLFAGSSSIVFYECIEKLNELGENKLAEELENVKNYLTSANKYLNTWTD